MVITEVAIIILDMAEQALSRLVARSRDGHERVAFLHGTSRDGRIEVQTVEPVVNTYRRPGGFGVGAADFRAARARDSLVGLFHTHRHECLPSEADRRLIARVPLLHLIGSPGSPPSGVRLGAWIAAADGSLLSMPPEVRHR